MMLIVIFLCGKTTVIRIEGMSPNSHSFIHSNIHSFVRSSSSSTESLPSFSSCNKFPDQNDSSSIGSVLTITLLIRTKNVILNHSLVVVLHLLLLEDYASEWNGLTLRKGSILLMNLYQSIGWIWMSLDIHQLFSWLQIFGTKFINLTRIIFIHLWKRIVLGYEELLFSITFILHKPELFHSH